jgi:hypothetical protein
VKRPTAAALVRELVAHMGLLLADPAPLVQAPKHFLEYWRERLEQLSRLIDTPEGALGAPERRECMTAGQIRAAAMAKRTAQGLKLRLLTPDGETTLYPKDHATKAKWVADATRKGYTVLEG